MQNFKKIAPEALSGNTFSMIGTDWMLVTAKDPEGKINTMTASWGGVGILWNEPVAFVFVRPQRYTHEFTESTDGATLTFFGDGSRKMLSYMGTVSGRDEDKIAKCGLTPVMTDEGEPAFEEARVILSCRKLYTDVLKKECFCDKKALGNYPEEDFHTVYVYKIEGVYIKE